MKKILLLLSLFTLPVYGADFTFELSPYTPGQIVTVGTPSCPNGTLLADGSNISRVDYADLFGKFGTAYGAGNGTSTFRIPDMRGIFLRGAGSSYDPNFSARGTFTFPLANPNKVGSTQSDATKLLLNGSSHNNNPEGNSPTGIITHWPGQWMAGTEAGFWGGYVNRLTLRGAMDTNWGGAAESRPVNMSVLHCIAY